MSFPFVKCTVTVLGAKPKIFKGYYWNDIKAGVYGSKLQADKMRCFGICKDVVPVVLENMKIPHFVVDQTTELALPVGGVDDSISLEQIKDLSLALEVGTKKRYVKAMTKKAVDTITMLICGGAGLGIGLFALHFIGIITGNQFVI